MRTHKQWFEILFASLLCLFLIGASLPILLTSTIPPWPESVTVAMFELNADGSRTGTPCQPGNLAYGCTAFCAIPPKPTNPNDTDICERWRGYYGYPYDSSTITIPIETYYLLNVLPGEMSPWLYEELPALTAQAIAARSYIGWRIVDSITEGYSINNSTEFQAFIPYKFDSQHIPATPYPPLEERTVDPIPNPCGDPDIYGDKLNNAQRRVCDAVSVKRYISYYGDAPAFTEFSSDALGSTEPHTNPTHTPYMISVPDPISTTCDSNNTGDHSRGLSTEGANRWARGHECSSERTEDDDPLRVGEPWSLSWYRSDQILFHYYTKVQLRDLSGDRLSPEYRWNPLALTTFPEGQCPPIMYRNQSCTFKFTIQNTGTTTWNPTYTSFRYSGWSVGTQMGEETTTLTQSVESGDPVELSISITPPSNSANPAVEFIAIARCRVPGVAEDYNAMAVP